MLKVLLVDDEPFILQGMQVLLDWKEMGFEIVCAASDGKEALDYLMQNTVDMIIADINMPGLSGLELLRKIRQEKISDAYFIILSGYAEFSYAQEAMQYDCSSYMLKPVEKEELIEILKSISAKNLKEQSKILQEQKMEEAYLARNMIALLRGKYDTINLEYIKNHMRLSEGVVYVEIALDGVAFEDEIEDEQSRSYHRKLYDSCLSFLKEDGAHCIFDVSAEEKIYDIGLIYCDYIGEKRDQSMKKYLEELYCELTNRMQIPINILVGKKVTDISQIAKSFASVGVLRSLQGFYKKKQIYYYEEDIQVNDNGIVLCKNSLDVLVNSIESNQHVEIRKSVDYFFEEMQSMGVTGKTMELNINYLLFQLIHLATRQDDGVNQEEILRFISESTFEDGLMRGSKTHITRFACEYGDYLMQLRKNVSRGVLGEIEKEVCERYTENLTLKELSEKYFVNSAYLGQLFRKKYGVSFKDYLNNYRIEQAEKLLIRTDKKIYQIAEAVGYHDLDYFVNRFIAAKGCTPAKYRKQVQNG